MYVWGVAKRQGNGLWLRHRWFESSHPSQIEFLTSGGYPACFLSVQEWGECVKDLGVLVMAAGKGTRMRSALPKVLHPVLDRPMLDYLLRSAASCGAEATAVLVGSGGDQVEAHLKERFPEVEVLWQREQLGTAHAVLTAMSWWERFKTVVVLNGDLPMMRPESLRSLLERCRTEGPDCAVISFVARDPGAYGRVLRTESGVRVVEYRDASAEQRRMNEVNAGCYVFRTSALRGVIERIGNRNAQGEYYLPDALSLMAEEGRRVEAYPMPEAEMMGVNTQAELAHASALMRDRIAAFWMERGVRMTDPASAWIGPDVELAQDVVLMPNVQLWGCSRVGEGSFIGSGSILTNAVLGRGVTLAAHVLIEDSEMKDFSKAGPFVYIRDGCCLAERAFAGKFVEMKKTTVGQGSKVPHLSYLGDATLGLGVNIGAGTITCNYDGREKHPTKIGDHCFVGSDTMFVAPVTMGNGAATAAGSVITEPVPDGALGVGRARQRNIDGWASRRAKD